MPLTCACADYLAPRGLDRALLQKLANGECRDNRSVSYLVSPSDTESAPEMLLRGHIQPSASVSR
jgi:hypothetical protein